MIKNTAEVNQTNREKALIEAGDALAERLYAYATTQTEVDLVEAWNKAAKDE